MLFKAISPPLRTVPPYRTKRPGDTASVGQTTVTWMLGALVIGQVAAAKLSSRLTGLGLDAVDRIEKLFKAAGLPTQIKLTKVQYAKLLDAMLLDKKASGGEVKFVLAEQIGKVRFGEKVPVQHIQEVMFPSGK